MSERERTRLMDSPDYDLSMRISPRARNAEDNAGLRTLLVRRLTDTSKAIVRISLRGGSVSIFCEPCARWCPAPEDDFPLQWKCPSCSRVYQVEFAVLEEVEGDEEPAG